MELLGKTNINFMAKRYVAFALSGVLIISGLTALVQISRGHANLGIDFSGGTALQFRFAQPVALAGARAALSDGGFADAELQEITSESTGGHALLVRVKRQTSIEEKAAGRITALLKERFPGNELTVESTTEIGPTIGQKLRDDAVLATTIALLGIMIYIALRFEFRFGVAAAIATIHDVLAVAGIFYVLEKEFTLLVVTSLLTLAGYSLTDTVVVFDRIRENLRKRRQESVPEVINASINQVLSRTVVVSLCMVMAVAALYWWGGHVLQDFSLAMLMGVVIGTYSSIFVASPLLMFWRGPLRM
ncbi:MAG: protein translocase subunit SecF [Nitrospirae bacterium]|nr:protein translocase subunit SecF [Nitrospirota bacterium]